MIDILSKQYLNYQELFFVNASRWFINWYAEDGAIHTAVGWIGRFLRAVKHITINKWNYNSNNLNM